MKRILLSLLLLISFTACNKDQNEITIVTCFTDGVASSETSCPTGSGGEVNTKTSKLLVE